MQSARAHRTDLLSQPADNSTPSVKATRWHTLTDHATELETRAGYYDDNARLAFAKGDDRRGYAHQMQAASMRDLASRLWQQARALQ